MVSGPNGGFFTGFFTLSTQPSVIQEIEARRSQAAPPDFQQLEEQELRAIQAAVIRAGESITNVRSLLESDATAAGASLVSLTSFASLGLDTDGSFSTLTATEEVNSTPTSFSTHVGDFVGSSTSAVTIDGIYDGSQGDDTITVKVRRGGTVGDDSLRVQLFDSAGAELDDFVISASYIAGTEITTDIGVTLAFGAGDLTKDDTFTFDVFASTPTAVDPDQILGGSGATDPDLEYGFDVTAGSFTVNGVTIAVDPTVDTLNDVLARINSLVPDVTATFDEATETVSITRNTTGPLEITLADDTSGFLAAVKLDGATTVLGEFAEQDQPIEDVDPLNGIKTGTFSINGTEFQVDITTDSLQDVVDAINDADLGVVASFDEATNKFTIRQTNEVKGDQLVLDDGTSDFFLALGVEDGEHTPGQQGTVDPDRFETGSRRIAEAAVPEIRNLVRELNALFEGLRSEALAKNTTANLYLSRLTEAIEEAFGDSTRDLRRSGFGLDVDLGGDASKVFLFDEAGSDKFIETFVSENADSLEFFLGEDSDSGFLGGLQEVVDELAAELTGELGSIGVLLNQIA